METTPPVAAFLSARGEPLGGVALGDPLMAGWEWGVAEGVVFAPVSTEHSQLWIVNTGLTSNNIKLSCSGAPSLEQEKFF